MAEDRNQSQAKFQSGKQTQWPWVTKRQKWWSGAFGKAGAFLNELGGSSDIHFHVGGVVYRKGYVRPRIGADDRTPCAVLEFSVHFYVLRVISCGSSQSHCFSFLL